ncbi:MJ0042 family finger-like domain-containing protein [Nitrosospira sp. Nl5]|uniref:zinc-ribbon and DUF3426 domain-containing protein n=1 Tax=Nitrosospira sp. Nl5 TaxID=200120 RepID=UPI00088981B4|nr:zinc-ribbon and DUF3426 domain-containing protein [Nitrosospira sp. Nl5]SCY67756.1 MJ0042 family finger-like domain-containing protein [Nitrosospira sp. Nl5]
MALVTRCPNCATAFRVTPLHLQAHGGHVRCGHCAQVFNGFATLATVQEPEAVDLTRTTVADTSESTHQVSFADIGDLSAPPVSDQEVSSQDPGQERTQPDAIAEAVTPEASTPQPPAAEEPKAQASDTISTPQDHTAADDAARNEAAENQAAENYAAENYAEENYAFDTVAPRKASLGWGLGSLFLLVVLAAQATYFYRAELSVLVPDARPYLEQYCELLQCTVPLPQNAALLSIESSEMQADTQRSGFVTLSAAVRNHAPYAQAFPSFELTLTDPQDQPLASHIFSPDAYLEKYMDPAGAIASNQEFNVKLHLNSGDLNAAGYRLHVFYPGS